MVPRLLPDGDKLILFLIPSATPVLFRKFQFKILNMRRSAIEQTLTSDTAVSHSKILSATLSVASWAQQ